MEDLYNILGCSMDSTIDDIKQRYRALARLSHPDSAHVDDSADGANDFFKISNAYKILSDSDLRHEYDIRWHQKNLLQEFPVHEIVQFDELDEDEDEQQFAYPCRCGDSFILTHVDVLLKFDYVSCSSCSLCINIIYPKSSSNEETNVQSICSSHV